jgi:hypothetical protein
MNTLTIPDELIQTVVDEAVALNHSAVTLPVVADLVQAAFRASLLSNEKLPCRFRLAFVPPDEGVPLIRLEQGIALDPANIRRLAAGAGEQAAVGVWQGAAGLELWGIAHRLSFHQVFVDAVGAGQLKLGCWTGPTIVIEPNEMVLVDSDLGGQAPLIAEILKTDHADLRRRLRVASVLRSILRRVALLGHGGTIVMVGRNSSEWHRCITSWGAKSSTPSSQLTELLERIGQGPDELKAQHPLSGSGLWTAMLNNVEQFEQAYADLTMMDGAIVVDSDLRLIGAGAKIVSKSDFELWCVWPSKPSRSARCSLSELGGTRHQSAARLVNTDRQCAAFVVSSDGPITAFASVLDTGEVVAIRRLDWAL